MVSSSPCGPAWIRFTARLACRRCGSATPSIASSEPIDDSFAAELRAIEQAQRTVSAGDFKGALALLDDWAVRCPHRHFDEEAAVLRIEAVSEAVTGNRAIGWRSSS
jgi:hypothetical protein